MSNPLVAQREDSTQPFSGVQILESVEGTRKAIESGDWAAGVLSTAGTALDALSMAMDPFGAILAAGVGWLMEHVGPVSEALDSLTGDADQIRAHSETWKNISAELADITDEMNSLVQADTAGWLGEAGDAYRRRSENTAKLLSAAKSAADGAAKGIGTAGEVVASVRTLVRDIIAELVAHLISWALQVLATLGIALLWVVPQVIAEVAKVATQIAEITSKLIRAFKTLSPLLQNLEKGFGDATDALRKIKEDSSSTPPTERTSPSMGEGDNGPASTKSAGADSGPGGPQPGSRGLDGPASTSPAGTDAPGGTGASPGAPGGNGSSPNGSASTTSSSAPRMRDNGAGSPNTKTPAGQEKSCGDPIDVATGAMVLPQTDVDLAGALPLVIGRVHKSSYRVGRCFGSSWASTLDQRLEVDDEGVCFAAEDGTLLLYPHPAPGASVTAVMGPQRPLARADDGGYTITDPAGGRMLYFAPGDSVLPLTAITDRNGHRIEFDHDEAGTPVEVRHSGGYRVRVEAEDGLVTDLYLRTDDGDVRLVHYDYTGGNLTGVVNESGQPLRFTYDAAGRVTSWTDRNGAWYRYTFDGGRCVRAEGSGGFLSGSLDYDDDHRITSWTDSLGHRTAYYLNDANQTVREVDPLGNETHSQWDEQDRLLSRTDPLGRTVRFDYDEHGNLTRATRPDGSQMLIEYNELRLPVTVVAPDGTVSRRRYDERGNLTAEIDPSGATTTYTHDEHGHLTDVTDALGNTRRMEANVAGLPVGVVDPHGATTRYERDGFGRVTAITDPAGGVTRFGWTTDGKPAWRSLSDGTTERWAYDGEGNLRTHVDALGQVTETEVIHFDLPSVDVRPDGTRLAFGYDTELRLTSVTNEQGLVWRYTYDAAGNLLSETDFNDRTVTYRHDAAGQLVERTNGMGETTRFTHDVFGNVIERRSGGTTSTFTYDPLGRLIGAASPEVQVAFRRDPAGRVLAETINGRTVDSVYDPLGRRVRRRTPSGAESVWDYDANSRPVTLHTAGRTLRFDYDSAGNEIQRQLGRDALLAQSWDVNHKLLSQSLTGAAGRQVQERSYTYRADGFLAAMDDRLTGPRTFDLDRAGRVTAVTGSGWTEQYAYDAAGNVANASWPTSPGADAEEIGDREYSGTLIRRAGKVRYEHDAQGRVVLRQRKRLSHKPETWRYFWDADDRLSEVLTPDGTRWRYVYDPLGRRIAKQRLTPDGSRIQEQVEFVWDGLVLAEQAHTDGIPNGPGLGDVRVTVWNYEPGTSRPLTQTERSPLRHAPQQWIDEQFYSIITDLVGTPTELIDDQGGIAWFHRTTLWGATTDQSREGADTPLRFPGQYHDPETGFNYNFHRHYDPVSGRYSSADPIGLEGGTNPHQYVPNPHTWLDPLGLVPCRNEQIAEQARKFADYYQGKVPQKSDGWNTAAVIVALDHEGKFQHVVAGSGGRLNEAQKEAAKNWKHIIPQGRHGHAEINALEEIHSRGWAPVGGGASRNVCIPCGTRLYQEGADLGGTEFRGNGSGENYFFW